MTREDTEQEWPFELNLVCFFLLRILANPALSILFHIFYLQTIIL